jgi:hypothetical protein
VRLTCDLAKGGCGNSIEISKQVLTAIWQAHQQKRELDCVTDGCARKLTLQQIENLVTALQKSHNSGTKQPPSRHLSIEDVPRGGRAYGSGR